MKKLITVLIGIIFSCFQIYTEVIVLALYYLFQILMKKKTMLIEIHKT